MATNEQDRTRRVKFSDTKPEVHEHEIEGGAQLKRKGVKEKHTSDQPDQILVKNYVGTIPTRNEEQQTQMFKKLDRKTLRDFVAQYIDNEIANKTIVVKADNKQALIDEVTECTFAKVRTQVYDNDQHVSRAINQALDNTNSPSLLLARFQKMLAIEYNRIWQRWRVEKRVFALRNNPNLQPHLSDLFTEGENPKLNIESLFQLHRRAIAGKLAGEPALKTALTTGALGQALGKLNAIREAQAALNTHEPPKTQLENCSGILQKHLDKGTFRQERNIFSRIVNAIKNVFSAIRNKFSSKVNQQRSGTSGPHSHVAMTKLRRQIPDTANTNEQEKPHDQKHTP